MKGSGLGVFVLAFKVVVRCLRFRAWGFLVCSDFSLGKKKTGKAYEQSMAEIGLNERGKGKEEKNAATSSGQAPNRKSKL